MTEDNIIKKIQALLKMGQRGTNHDGSSNEAEATLAMQKAQELLAKYNLNLAQLETAADSTAVAGGKRVKEKTSRSAMYKWQRDLWAALADANFCWHWVQKVYEDRIRYGGVQTRHVNRHFLLGREENVAAVLVMGDYLCDTIERLQPYGVAGRMSTSANSWREGCAARLIERIQKQVEVDNVVVPSSGTAITLANVADREYAANYDYSYGEGAYAKSQQRAAERRKEWDLARAEEKAKRAAETPAEKAHREAVEAKQQRENEKYWEREWKKQQRQAAKKDWAAYESGQKAGDSISLHRQVKDGE
jgi:Protein of unknown function (DUF2786)